MGIKSHYLEDSNGNKFYPYAHANATFDSNGVKVGTRLDEIEKNINAVNADINNHIDNGDVHITSTERKKLSEIADGAEVNVMSDWNETDETSDAFIKNKPASLPANGGNADTVNGHTVESNVPQNAVFTDTVYDDTGLSNRVKTIEDDYIDSEKLAFHTDNSNVHITPSERENWNDADDKKHVHDNKAVLDNTTASFTTEEKAKIASLSEDYDAKGSADEAKSTSKAYTDSKIADEVTARDSAISTAKNSAISIASSDATAKANKALSDAKSYADVINDELEEHTSNSDIHFTTTERTKLSGVAAGAEVNQNAFSKVSVGSNTIEADSKTDTLTIAAGTGISVSGDTTNDKVTITNSGVRSISTGSSNGTISVNTNGTSANVAVKGLGSAAYTASTAYDTKGSADAALSDAKEYTDSKIDAIVGEGASETLDTIGEISQAIEDHQDVTDALNAAIGNKVDKVSGKGLSTNDFTTAYKTKLDGISSGANAYTHPSYTAKSSGLYKITVDATGHVSAVTAVAKSDITALGIPSSDTNTHYSSKNVVAGSSTATSNTTSALSNGSVYLISVENGAATSAHKISGSGATTVTTDASGNIVISSTDTNTTYSLSSFGITATASEINKLDGLTATTTELNYVDGVTSNIQTQLNGKASSSHTHSYLPLSGGTMTGNVSMATDKTFLHFNDYTVLAHVTDSTGYTGVTSGFVVGSPSTLTNIRSSTAPTVYRDSASYINLDSGNFSSYAAKASHTHSYAGSSSAGGSATSAVKLDSSAGDYNTPVYFSGGKPVACTSLDLNTTGSAAKLTTARTIDGVSFNGSAAITHYGECSTAAATAAKTVALTGFSLVTGARVMVKFTVTNTASSPTLNINSTGAKAIMYRGSAITAGYLAANRVYEFVYDGTDWELVGDINTNTTYTSLKNPYALTIQGNGTTLTNGTYDGSAAKTVNITPSSIGAATASHGTHVSYGTSTSALGTSSAGSATTVSRSDHVHALPALTSCTGTLSVAKGGTGATTAAAALTNLGITATAAELNKLDGVTATTTELNYVDGVTSNIQTQLDAKAKGSSKSATTAATAGWYRIATSASGISRCIGIFEIEATVSGKHTTAIITASSNYGVAASSAIQVLHCSQYSGNALTKARIVYHTTYSGNYAYVEVYNPSATAIPITVKLIGGTGWSLVAPSTAGSVPSGYSSKEVTLSNGTIVAGTFSGNATTATNVAWSGVTSKPSYYDAKAIKGITRSGTTFTYTCMDGTTGTFTQQDNNTTYSAATSSALGLVKIGSNITNSSGTISLTKANVVAALGYTPPTSDTNTTYSVATASANGLVPMFDAADGTIDSSSTDWVLTNNNGSIGWYKLPANAFNNTTYSNMTAATSSAAGKAGLVPAPAAGKQASFLRGDGTWAVPTNTTYSAATTSTAGLMSASDKSKLDAITASADSVSFSRSLTSGTKIGTITINGTATDLYCQTNTNTTNTTGSTNTSSKIFLVGATTQATAPQTYSHDTVYVGTDGCIYSGGVRVRTESNATSEPTQTAGDYWAFAY